MKTTIFFAGTKHWQKWVILDVFQRGIVERFSIYLSAKSNERRNYICCICLHWLKSMLYIKSCFLFGVPILLPDSISCGEAPGTGFDVKGTSQIATEPWMITWPTGIWSATQNWDLWYILQNIHTIFYCLFYCTETLRMFMPGTFIDNCIQEKFILASMLQDLDRWFLKFNVKISIIMLLEWKIGNLNSCKPLLNLWFKVVEKCLLHKLVPILSVWYLCDFLRAWHLKQETPPLR